MSVAQRELLEDPEIQLQLIVLIESALVVLCPVGVRESGLERTLIHSIYSDGVRFFMLSSRS